MPTIHYANGATIIIRRRVILNGDIVTPATDGGSGRATNSLTEDQLQRVTEHAKQHGGQYTSSGHFRYERDQAGEVLALAAELWGRPVATEISGDTEPVPTTARSLAASLPDVDLPTDEPAPTVSGFDNSHKRAELEDLTARAHASKDRYEQDIDTLAYMLWKRNQSMDDRLRFSANELAEIAQGAISRPTVLKILNGQIKLYCFHVSLYTTDEIYRPMTVEARIDTPQKVIYERAVRRLAEARAERGAPMLELCPFEETKIQAL